MERPRGQNGGRSGTQSRQGGPAAPTSQSVKLWHNNFNLDVVKSVRAYQSSFFTKPALPKQQAFLLQRFISKEKKTLLRVFQGDYFPTGDVVYSLHPLKEETYLGDIETFAVWAKPTGEEFTVGELFTDPSKMPEITRFLNVVLKSFMEGLGHKEYGKRSTYFSKDTKPFVLDKGISILPGFKLTIDKYMDTLKLNIDTSFRISSTHSIYYEYSEAIAYATDKDSAKSRFTSDDIVGKSFSILNELNSMVKIAGVDPSKTLRSPSPVEGFKTMKEYFEHKFGVILRESNQFVCFSEFKKRVVVQGDANKRDTVIERTYFPSEILYALGLKDSQKKDFHLMKQVAEHTKMTPEKKMRAIIDCSKLFKSICTGIGLGCSKIEQTPVDSKVLTAPDYTVRKRTNKSKNGLIFFNEEIYSEEAQLKDWAILYECGDAYLDDFYLKMLDSMEKMGVKVEEPYFYPMPNRAKLNDFKDALDEVKEKGYKFVLLLINKQTGDTLYKKIKEFSDLDAQILTQVSIVNDKVFSKRGYFDKINFQICSKLGYPLWIIERPPGLDSKSPMTMIMGADVYHSKGNESVSAVIGTLNQHYSKYVSLSRVQPKRGQEIMTQISEMVIECVEEFKAVNKKLPKRILFFRDGVGDQMIDLVKKHEIEMIKAGLEAKFPNEVPMITFILVTKRVSQKVLEGTAGSMNISNPRSGTIVSAQIIKNDMEFFMVAQNVTEGTANPTRYQIILNECGYTADALHLITFFQSFNYYGWTGAVKVPAVCQYAHKLAYHVGENYRQSNKFMKRNLFYL